MANLWNHVLRALEADGHMAGITRSDDRVRETAEVFTPAALVVEMLTQLPEGQWAPGKDVLDPACGDGQFLVGVRLARQARFDLDVEAAAVGLYGVDLMRDNVDRCRARLGGGVVVMGDALQPARRLSGQTDREHHLMLEIFGPAQGSLFAGSVS